jgi:hypothetical protein
VPSRVLSLAFVVLMGVSTASAQEWAKKMFTKTAHDFGTVVKGAKTEFRFEFKNIYVEDLHVASVRSSCGCTTPEVKKRDLKTYETSYILATYNTHAFVGHRSATVTVKFDKPFYAEVQLQVSGNIRGDIVVQPNFVNLGTVNQGHTTERAITVTQTNRPDWRVLDVRSANPNFEVDVIERSRAPGNVSYDLKVKLKDGAPAGYIKDQLVLVTNDRAAATFPIEVEGLVVPEITLSQSINFGSLEIGGKATKPLIVRGQKPFKITKIDCDDERFTFKLPDADAEPKALYTIPVTFTADGEPGKISQRIIVETDRGKATLPPVLANAIVRPNVTPTPVPTETPVSEPARSSRDTAKPDVSLSTPTTNRLPRRTEKPVASNSLRSDTRPLTRRGGSVPRAGCITVRKFPCAQARW